MTAAPRSDGSWDVVETVKLPRPLTRLELERPSVNKLGGDFAKAKAQIGDLQVTGAGDVATLDQQGSTWSAEVADPADSFELRYLLDGVTVRSVPSQTGRALAALAPLLSVPTRSDRVQIEVKGDSVHNLQCPLLDGDAQLCLADSSTATDLRLAEPLPGTTAVALVQYDLPSPQ